MTRTFRYVMFGLLYFVQGAGLAYFRNFQKPYLDGFNIDADAIGLLTSILLLPFILKIFFGMLSDRVNLFGQGHRKPYIVAGLVLAAIGFGSAGFVSPGDQFTLFAAAVLLGSFSVAFFDTTADGMAIDTTPREEQGTVQSIMVGGRAIGFILLSFLFGQVVGALGYRFVFLVMGGAMLIPLIFVLQVEEPAERDLTQSFDWSAFRELLRPRFLVFIVYTLVYSIGLFGIDGLPTFHMSSTFGAPETAIGNYGVLRGVGALLGALACGFLLNRIGRRVSAYIGLVVVGVIGAVFAVMGTVPAIIVWGLVWGAAWGFQETVFFSLAMDIADARIAASMFALMMAISNLGAAIGEGVGTGLTDNIGFGPVFVILAATNIILLPVIFFLFRIAPEIGSPSTVEEVIAPAK